ncbi:transcriptional repressor [Desulfovibrio sp. OttesenSCG-928-G15]|nr:transcriptional repressor [Desulfovibrio sp. OttesenSCG-928-G15]
MSDPVHTFGDYISQNGLKNTPQRRTIVEVFFKQGKHLTTEELYTVVRQNDPNIGQATVYRTLKLLCEAGLAKEQHFGESTARYEPIEDDSHHDHLICTACGKNIEVIDEEIERLQEDLARRHGFSLTSHRMILFGVCAACRSGKKRKAR